MFRIEKADETPSRKRSDTTVRMGSLVEIYNGNAKISGSSVRPEP
jgi:hypothetical protein